MSILSGTKGVAVDFGQCRNQVTAGQPIVQYSSTGPNAYDKPFVLSIKTDRQLNDLLTMV